MAFGEEQNRFFEEQAAQEMEDYNRQIDAIESMRLTGIDASLRRIASSMEVLITPVRLVVFAGEAIHTGAQAIRRDIKGRLDYLLKRDHDRNYGDFEP